ncbi:MAG: tetratricopeptide repeat protein [Candidatus Obscuribacterales bacterium]|nr:tetratricopeptide repeat protein [Candidatus Obscuribacterales bacterium]
MLALLGPIIFFFAMPEAPLNRAIALIKTNKAAAALPILEEIAQKQPDNMAYMPWLAQCYLSTDRLAEGRAMLDTSIKLKLPCSTVAPVVVNFSQYYCRKNDYPEAEKLINSAQTLCPSEDFQLERKSIYSQWAEYDAGRNLQTEALKHLEVLASMEGGLNPKLAHTMAELYREEAAIEETQKGNDQKAIQLLEKSLLVADEPASRIALAGLYIKNNEDAKALKHLSEVCKSDQNNLEARHRLIESAIKLEDWKCAQSAATELADRERCLENFELLASIDLKLNNFPGAVKALEDAIPLAPKDLDLLEKLEAALSNWSQDLVKHGKQEEAISVKTRAERTAEAKKELQKELNPEAEAAPVVAADARGNPPIALITSRIWLSKGSFTPEGEIKIRNIAKDPLSELSLTVAFYDNTLKKRTGSVSVSAAGSAHPLLPGQSRVLYFSSPSIVRAEHQLSVIIFWKGKLIRELPVVKER